MTQESNTRAFNTRELAGIYESQGYHREALEIYQSLRDTEGIRRMTAALEGRRPSGAEIPSAHRINQLFEQWLLLMILEKRLALFKSVTARF